MSGCIDSEVEYEISNEQLLVRELEHLGQNANIRERPISCTEMETSEFLPEHMLPLEREENDTDGRHCSASEMLLQREPSANTHCHGPAASEDPVARNQLIAISVLCFVFMVAEVIGELCLKLRLFSGFSSQ